MSLAETAGNKPNWAREIDSDNFQDIFSLTAAAAAKLQVVHGLSVIDQAGVLHNTVDCVATGTTLTMTDYANFGIGSKVWHVGAATPTLYVKCAKSSPGVIGDWYLEELTQAT